MDLKAVTAKLEEIASPKLAESWDNVGLLASPYRPRPIDQILLTVDLTEAVMNEAVELGVQLIVTYHPVIFRPMKRITGATATERVVQHAFAESIAIYSPHTSWDAINGGINDWLASALGSVTQSEPIAKNAADPTLGSGRLVQLKEAASVEALVQRIKEHCKLPHVRLSTVTPAREIKSVAICAGSGGSLFKDVQADLFWTGEMGHHEVLAANAIGAAVILCEHTNTERGYLAAVAKSQIEQALGGQVRVHVSSIDTDPLKVV